MVGIRQSAGDRIFLGLVYGILSLMAFVAIFPLMYVISVSITPFEEVLRHGGFVVFPRKITLDAYGEFLTRSTIPRAYGVTVFITVVGTAINLILTTLVAYPLSRDTLPGRRVFLVFILIPMVFTGGIIPTYIVVRSFGLLNSLWAMILPGAVWTFNSIVMKTFFERMEASLIDAAVIDGAGDLAVLVRIVLPLSLPVISTVGLFYGVAHWNEFFQAIIYISDPDKLPLQPVLRNILIGAEQATVDTADFSLPADTLKMAAVVLTAIPILMVYPFLQKHFTKGILLGSVKG
jgi:putative aldouronate transport system permease protein